MSQEILSRLARGTATASELCAVSGLPQPTLSRRLMALRGQVLPLGASRARRYGLLRRIRDLEPEIAVHQINASGEAQRYGTLYSLAADEFWFEGVNSGQAATGLFPGLPWFFNDARPQGFLGRLFPRQHPELDLPTDIRDWSDDMALYALARRGDDVPGDLILGDVSFSRWWERARQSPLVLEESQRQARYPQLAAQVTQGVDPGSSAAGEQPKFVGQLNSQEGVRSVIVKFSPSIHESVGRRWADLLIAESLALETLRTAGIDTVSTEIIEADSRIFLEVTRFDRVHAHGRRPVVTLASADAEFAGVGLHWPTIARELVAQRRLTSDDAERINRAHAFGLLIANTDMHNGNLALMHEEYGSFLLAPIYDMLPMRYAPVGGEVSTPEFIPPPPTGGVLENYMAMRGLAREFWMRVASDTRVSADFRRLAASNGNRVALI
ncbi:MAG: type II toxin-antitoxin system HipA family toxin YjjJ [Gammaproteobacteria bacterium]|nr:type II toxin-antitoxin system HipA family toxin YjjJ [Gammaproteobacteria bacterium]